MPWTVPLFLYSDHAEPWCKLRNRTPRAGAFRKRTGQVSSNNRFQRDDLGFLHKHCPTVQLVLVLPDFLGHFINVGSYKVIRDYVAKFLEPEE